jgi:hypothetical protein
MMNYKEIKLSELNEKKLKEFQDHIFSSTEEYKLECFEYFLDNIYLLENEDVKENNAVELFLSNDKFKDIRNKILDQTQEDYN